nr:MAG TPA: hypothetical protein [Caudoviricetes sp.]
MKNYPHLTYTPRTGRHTLPHLFIFITPLYFN